jgi:hypothetical protein
MSPEEHARIQGWEEDMINHPPHHTAGGIEAIEVIEAKLTPEQFEGYCLGNAIKYLLRCNHKGAKDQDIGKADWYLQRLLK